MWQSYGKGKSRAQLQAAHDKTSGRKKVCRICGKEKALDCFSPGLSECKWCNTKYRVGLNDRTRAQADKDGLPWTAEEDKVIKAWSMAGETDERIALYLKRTMNGVRGRRARLGINKRAKAAPKPLFNEFMWHQEDTIKKTTVSITFKKITVFSNTNVLWANIHKAFIAADLTDEDYKAWKIGVLA